MFAIIVTLFLVAIALFSYSSAHKDECKGWYAFMAGGWCVAALGALGILDMSFIHPADYGWDSWILAGSWLVLGIAMSPMSLVVIKLIREEEAEEAKQ